jgi:hypothetical protein
MTNDAISDFLILMLPFRILDLFYTTFTLDRTNIIPDIILVRSGVNVALKSAEFTSICLLILSQFKSSG